MVRTASKVEWTVVQNELESLQLEYTWIKQYDPRFNIKYRDDKSYPWVCVTWGEEFPRVFVGRGAKRKGNRYYGPYAQAWAIRETIDSLLRVFPMRSCTNGVFRNAKASGRPCLLAHIGKCSAPCVDWIDADAHRELVADVCDFLAGNTNHLVRRVRQADAGGLRRARVREGGRAARPARRPRVRHRAQRDRAGRRHGRRRHRPGRRRARGRRSRCSTSATAASGASAAGSPTAPTTPRWKSWSRTSASSCTPTSTSRKSRAASRARCWCR